MPSVSFVLKDVKSKVQTPIYLLFRYDSKRVKISTKEMIEPEYWNSKKKRIIPTTEVLNFQEVNNKLAKLQDKAFEIYENVKIEFKREPTTKELKNEFDKFLFSETGKIKKANQKKTFFDFFDTLIQVRSENNKVSNQRIGIYNRTKELLHEYQKETKNLIAFERFDEMFSINFRAFLEDKKKFAPNTIHKHFNVIRTVLNNAVVKGYKVHSEYKSSDFMPEKEESFEIALKIEEVEALHNIDFSGNKKLERVRDLFVIACYTGLRFSDLKNLRKEHLQGKYLSVVQEKTKKKNPLPIVIPVLQPVKEIFEKYEYEIPNELTNQKMNEYLKEMAKESNLFNGFVSYEVIRGGKRVLIEHERYNEVKTHTARRTFCSMSYKLGIPTQSIMAISGHKTEKSFLRYLKVENEEHAERSLKIWSNYYQSVKKDTGKTVKMVQTA